MPLQAARLSWFDEVINSVIYVAGTNVYWGECATIGRGVASVVLGASTNAFTGGAGVAFIATGAHDMTARWEHFPHEADMGIRGFGSTEAEAFEEAALAMTAVVTDLETIEPREAVTIECVAPDSELLLVEWLNTLIYEMSTRHMLFSRFKVQVDGAQVSAQAWGERVEPARHHPAVEIKGATYTALRVARENDEWVAQTVVDV